MSHSFLVFYLNFGPYHYARLGALARVLPGSLAVEICRKHEKYPWDHESVTFPFDMMTLFDAAVEDTDERLQSSKAVDLLVRVRPQAVLVVGYTDRVMRDVARAARRLGRPCILTTSTTSIDRPRYRLKELAKAIWCRLHYDALFLSGERSVRYFEGLGFNSDLIWRGTDVVDNEHFSARADTVRIRPDDFRKHFGLPEKYFLTVGRLSPEKNFVKLLNAYFHYRRLGGAWDLVVIGSGPQERELHALSEASRHRGVHFLGWQSYNTIPAYYGLASCFVLPSVSETWGLVVNEAMACGLPVLVSRNCGCVPELCQRGINGYDFDPFDEEMLADLMLQMSSGEEDLVKMGNASRRIIANFTPETWALSLRDCFKTVISNRVRAMART
ncbi:MAG: glycosyltransferase family 4 protein [Thermodesulfobacteriota bacterium]